MTLLVLVLLIGAVVLAAATGLKHWFQRDSVKEYERALDRLSDMSHQFAHVGAGSLGAPDGDIPHHEGLHAAASGPEPAATVALAEDRGSAPAGHPHVYPDGVPGSSRGVMEPPATPAPPAPPLFRTVRTRPDSLGRYNPVRPVADPRARGPEGGPQGGLGGGYEDGHDPWAGLRAIGDEAARENSGPWLVEEAAKVVGVFDDPEARAPGVEANARLTATTGIVLVVLFFLEGLTLPVITRYITWHIVLGLALIPPVLLKIGSTSWRFTRYYLGDQRYRRAGPPHPLLRVLGPLVIASTVVLIASGVALWAGGTRNMFLLRIHQASFVIWFGVLAIHLLSHAWRALRLASADSRDLKARRRVRVPGARARRLAVALSLVLGVAVGSLGVTVTTGWSHGIPPATNTATTPAQH